MIDSRRRRYELFKLGLFHPVKGLLARLGVSEKERRDLERVVFFQGSFFFSARTVPGLDGLPRTLVGEKAAEQGDARGEIPVSQNGDSFRVVTVKCLTAPSQLAGRAAPAAAAAASASSSSAGQDPGAINVAADCRCDGCTNAFSSIEALLSHCQITGHAPVYQGTIRTIMSCIFVYLHARLSWFSFYNASNLTHCMYSLSYLFSLDDSPLPATREDFLSYCNVALNRAMGERLARWGRDYIDPSTSKDPTDRDGRSLGVSVFRAYSCELGLHRQDFNSPLSLTLTVDLKAKILRKRTVIDQIYEGYDPANPYTFSRREQENLKRQWIGEVVICTYDKKCYSITDLMFDKTPNTLPIPDKNMSHTEYFANKKNIRLKFPNSSPVVQVLGRNDSMIYLPAEVICGNELEPNLKMQLPLIASYKPKERDEAINEIKRFLKPGAQRTRGVGGGFLPALGIVLKEDRFSVPVTCLPLPQIVTAGIEVPKKSGMWAPLISKGE